MKPIKDLLITLQKLIEDNLPVDIKEDSYTVQKADVNRLILMNKATAQTITIPNNNEVAFPIGCQLLCVQKGLGQITIVGNTDVILNSPDANVSSRGQYSTLSMIKIDTNTWLLIGDLAATL